tara:strand:- start:5558 stop:7306 length:1749 start_codon:yes stop_codon:yes gene_type:complete
MDNEDSRVEIYKEKMNSEDRKSKIKKTRCYFEICKKNINSEKKKKFEINENMLELGLKKKVLLELKYHELTSKIGWIQISIIIASTAITFIQTADGVFEFPESFIATIVSISLSTYVALILAISRFFKFDELKEQIVNLLSTYALYINKLKIRKQILIDHNFDYYKRDIDHEYNEWNKLKDVFEKDGSAELKVSIDNEIDMLLTKKDELKYREEMITLQLQEFIIEQQDAIYGKMEPLMFSHLYKYKTNVGCLNYVMSRVFHTTSFHKKARDMYCSQEIEKVSHANDIEVKTNMLKKLNTELKELYKENKLLQKVKNTIEDTELRKKMEQILEKKLNIREDLINSRSSVDDTKKLLKAYRTNQNAEKIHNSLNKNARIEHELGIRNFESFNVSDLEKKEDAINSYNYLYNTGGNKVKDIDKLKYDVVNYTQELYYPDEYYDIEGIEPACKGDLELGLNKEGTRYASSLSSFSYSSDSDSGEDRYVKKKVFNRIRRETAKSDIIEENNIKFKKMDFLDNGEEMEEVDLKDENGEKEVSSNSEEQVHSDCEDKKGSSSFLANLNLFGSRENNNTDSDSDINDKV